MKITIDESKPLQMVAKNLRDIKTVQVFKNRGGAIFVFSGENIQCDVRIAAAAIEGDAVPAIFNFSELENALAFLKSGSLIFEVSDMSCTMKNEDSSFSIQNVVSETENAHSEYIDNVPDKSNFVEVDPGTIKLMNKIASRFTTDASSEMYAGLMFYSDAVYSTDSIRIVKMSLPDLDANCVMSASTMKQVYCALKTAGTGDTCKLYFDSDSNRAVFTLYISRYDVSVSVFAEVNRFDIEDTVEQFEQLFVDYDKSFTIDSSHLRSLSGLPADIVQVNVHSEEIKFEAEDFSVTRPVIKNTAEGETFSLNSDLMNDIYALTGKCDVHAGVDDFFILIKNDSVEIITMTASDTVE